MAVSVTITQHREFSQRLGNALMETVDLTFDVDAANYAMTEADRRAVGMRRVHQILGPSIIRDDEATDVGIGVSWEIDSDGVPTFHFWECGGDATPLDINTADHGALVATRFTFIGV